MDVANCMDIGDWRDDFFVFASERLREEYTHIARAKFVNHAFPSGGVSGISYANWRLGNGANWAATMAQFVRYVVGLCDCGLFLQFLF